MTTLISSIPANVVVDTSATIASNEGTVVFHDIAAVKAVQPSVSAYSELERLATAKSEWEATAYRTSNDQLYALLQRCYGLYHKMCAHPDTAKQLKADVDKYLVDKGAKCNSSSHTLTKIVKAVFGADRRRVSAYSIALRAALASKVAVADIPQYIRNSGGVEELRLAKSPNAKTPKQKALEAAQIVDQTIIANLSLPVPAGAIDLAKVGEQHVLIVTQRADGTFDLNAVISAASAVNAALAAYYSQNKAAAAAAEVVDKQVRQHNALNDAISAAAQPVLQ